MNNSIFKVKSGKFNLIFWEWKLLEVVLVKEIVDILF